MQTIPELSAGLVEGRNRKILIYLQAVVPWGSILSVRDPNGFSAMNFWEVIKVSLQQLTQTNPSRMWGDRKRGKSELEGKVVTELALLSGIFTPNLDSNWIQHSFSWIRNTQALHRARPLRGCLRFTMHLTEARAFSLEVGPLTNQSPDSDFLTGKFMSESSWWSAEIIRKAPLGFWMTKSHISFEWSTTGTATELMLEMEGMTPRDSRGNLLGTQISI